MNVGPPPPFFFRCKDEHNTGQNIGTETWQIIQFDPTVTKFQGKG